MEESLTSYQLSRSFWDFSFNNPELISPNHSAIYFFAIEHCNRLGWKKKFGFPTQMVMDAIGIKKHETYIRYFNDLVDWGFFTLVQKSTNQYSANIISLPIALPKNGKALDKAIRTHAGKQTQPNGESNRSIDKPDNLITNNLITEPRIKNLGNTELPNFLILKSPYANEKNYRMYGVDGVTEYLNLNGGDWPMNANDESRKKFVRNNDKKVFEDHRHIMNAIHDFLSKT